jgi:hypothetical protein
MKNLPFPSQPNPTHPNLKTPYRPYATRPVGIRDGNGSAPWMKRYGASFSDNTTDLVLALSISTRAAPGSKNATWRH